MMNRLRDEPALVAGLASAVIALALAFGLPLTDEQVGGIMAVVVALLAVVTRTQVTPSHRLNHGDTDDADEPDTV